jgi:hypothetical protein
MDKETVMIPISDWRVNRGLDMCVPRSFNRGIFHARGLD